MRNNGFGIKNWVITIIVLVISFLAASLIVRYVLPLTPLASVLMKAKGLVFFSITVVLMAILEFIAMKIFNKRY